jgi:thiamine biosynthesis lipoprotein
MPSPLALTPRTRALLVIGLIVLAALTIHRLWWAGPAGPYVAIAGETMGTTWEVKLASADLGPEEIRRAAAVAQAAVDDVVSRMSTWEPDSEISRFNAHRSTDPFPVSAATLEVMKVAEQASAMTRDGFDVTVAPLVAAWGFGMATPPEAPPDDATIAALLEHVGHRLIEVDAGTGTLRKRDPAVEVDLSAIAKGYGVDRVAEALEAEGHHDYLVEVGGELRVAGRKLDGQPWRVAIERPTEGMRQIHETLVLADAALATSGDYRNFYERDGRRISHTIDPRTGRPIAHTLASVSVVHSSAMWADALATGLDVLGPAAGYHVAETLGIPAYFIVRTGAAGFSSRPTTTMQALLRASREDEPAAP